MAGPATYESVLLLGRGGMGTVYLARARGEAGFERLVVVKRMHDHMIGDDGAVRRFLDEARIAAQIHHANVVGIQHVGRDERGLYLVLDYVEGDSLDGLVRRAVTRGKPLSARIVARTLLDGLAGLHAAHLAEDAIGRPLNVLHRDVSPQNLLIGRDGTTRLTDFGIARVERAKGVTGTGQLAGKSLFMSPEYLRREAVDARLDVYAMGMTAWIAFAGREPWPDAADAQIMALVLQRDVPDLARAAPGVPPEIAAVVMRALSPSPADRYATAAEMAEALAAAARGTVGIASQSEVARSVDELVGADLAARKQRIRDRTAHDLEEATFGNAIPDHPVAAPELARPSKAEAPRKRVARAAVVATLGIAVTIALVAVTRGSRTEVAQTVPASAPSAPPPPRASDPPPIPIVPASKTAPPDPPTPTAKSPPPKSTPPGGVLRPPSGISKNNPYK